MGYIAKHGGLKFLFQADKSTCPESTCHCHRHLRCTHAGLAVHTRAAPHRHIHALTPGVLVLTQYLLSMQVTNSVQPENRFLSLLKKFSFFGHSCCSARLIRWALKTNPSVEICKIIWRKHLTLGLAPWQSFGTVVSLKTHNDIITGGNLYVTMTKEDFYPLNASW